MAERINEDRTPQRTPQPANPERPSMVWNDEGLADPNVSRDADRRMGGPTGGDVGGAGQGPAIGETHPGDEATADRLGRPEKE